jgi:DnaJ-class molecular chaperone
MSGSLTIILSDQRRDYFDELAKDFSESGNSDPSQIVDYALATLQALEKVTGQDPVTFINAIANGSIKIVVVSRTIPCPDCEGKGWVEDSPETSKKCPLCKGLKKVNI